MAGLRTFRTQLRRLLVDADHLPRQFLQPGLRVERLVVKFDPVPQLSNPAAPRLRAEEPRACRGDKTQLDMHAGHRRTHTQAHKRRHTYRKKKTDCVPTQPATRSKNKFPIASCVVPRSIECNTSMQMSSAENPSKENRLTLIPCSIWRASSSELRHRDVPCRTSRGVGPRNVTADNCAPPANFLGRPPFEAEQGFVPSPVATHLEQRVAPQSLLLATTSSPRIVGAQPLRLVVPRRWPRPRQKAPHAPAEDVHNGI